MSIQNRLRSLIFPHQHPEAALRYIPIVELLKKKHLEGSKILEVGSGSYGITPYLKQPITGVDYDFSEPETALLRQVKGKGERLPFNDNEFDVCVLSDVLEHIVKKSRQKTLDEAVRVSRKYVILSGPFGELAAGQDKLLADYSIKKLGRMHPFFKEHLEYGLPEVLDIERFLKTNKKVKSIKIVGESLNLKIREKLMKIFIAKNKLQFYFYLKGLMPLVPILQKLNKKPCYRTLILITLK